MRSVRPLSDREAPEDLGMPVLAAMNGVIAARQIPDAPARRSERVLQRVLVIRGRERDGGRSRRHL